MVVRGCDRTDLGDHVVANGATPLASADTDPQADGLQPTITVSTDAETAPA